MISDQVPKFIGDQFDQPSNAHGKTGPKWLGDLDGCMTLYRQVNQHHNQYQGQLNLSSLWGK